MSVELWGGGGHPNPAAVRTLGSIVSLIIVVVVANQRTKDGDFSSHFVRTDSKRVSNISEDSASTSPSW